MCDLIKNFLAKREVKAIEEGHVKEQLQSIKILIQKMNMTAESHYLELVVCNAFSIKVSRNYLIF